MKSQPVLLLVVAALTCGALAASAVDADGRNRFYVTSVASSLVDEGLAAPAPTGAEAAAFQQVPPPGIEFRPNVAQSTRDPWINSNGYRFQRGIKKANYAKLPAGAAPLAAAEAFTFDVDAILNPDPADLEELRKMLRFLKTQDQPRLPVMANIGVVDDQSPAVGDVLNMLTRRNLLYRVVSAPDRQLLTVQLGSEEFPTEAAANPSDFAARVRAKVGDDNRLVRLYGTSTVIAHLTGDGEHARLYLLSYGGRRRQQGRSQEGVRVRVLGRYQPVRLVAFGAAQDAKLTDVENPGQATEFSMPAFDTFASVDLDRVQ